LVFFNLFVKLWVFVYPMLPVSLDCPFLIAPSVFSNVYAMHIWKHFSYVISLNYQWLGQHKKLKRWATRTPPKNRGWTQVLTKGKQFLLISSARFSSCLIYVSCVCLLIVVSNAYCVVFVLFFFVLCTVCCQFIWIVQFWLVLL
jgi:hypothetical protein